MKVYQDGLNGYSRSLESASSSFAQSASRDVNNFVNTMARVWCSAAAKKFGGQLRTTLDSANAAITSLNNDLNELISTNVRNYNTVEEDSSVSFKQVMFSKPQIDALNNIKEKFADGGVGMEPDASPLITEFDNIYNTYVKLFDEMKNSFNNQLFDQDEQQALKTKIESIKQEFTTKFDELKSTFNTRITDEQEARKRLATQNKANIDAI